MCVLSNKIKRQFPLPRHSPNTERPRDFPNSLQDSTDATSPNNWSTLLETHLNLYSFKTTDFCHSEKKKQLCPSSARKATVHVIVYLEQTFFRGCSSSVKANKLRNLIAVVTYRLVPHPLLHSDRILKFVIRIYDCHFPKILQQTPGNQKNVCSCTNQQSS